MLYLAIDQYKHHLTMNIRNEYFYCIICAHFFMLHGLRHRIGITIIIVKLWQANCPKNREGSLVYCDGEFDAK